MINAKNVSFSYRKKEQVLRGVDLTEEKGHCIAFLGNNGAGKSTFLKCLNRILEPDGGTIVVDGMKINETPLRQIAKKISYVEQHTDTGRLTVYDTVLLGRKPHMKLSPTPEDYRIVNAVIERMGLKNFSLRYTDELSGGELQKVIIARALAQQPRVLLLDEPTASLDLKNQHEVMRMVSDIARTDDIAVVVVIHDLNLALQYCDRFLLINEGRAVAYGGSSVITAENIRNVFGVDTQIVTLNGKKVITVSGL